MPPKTRAFFLFGQDMRSKPSHPAVHRTGVKAVRATVVIALQPARQPGLDMARPVVSHRGIDRLRSAHRTSPHSLSGERCDSNSVCGTIVQRPDGYGGCGGMQDKARTVRRASRPCLHIGKSTVDTPVACGASTALHRKGASDGFPPVIADIQAHDADRKRVRTEAGQAGA